MVRSWRKVVSTIHHTWTHSLIRGGTSAIIFIVDHASVQRFRLRSLFKLEGQESRPRIIIFGEELSVISTVVVVVPRQRELQRVDVVTPCRTTLHCNGCISCCRKVFREGDGLLSGYVFLQG